MRRGLRTCFYCGDNYKVGRVNRQREYYCHKHYMQMKRYGEIKEKTVRDINEYTIHDDGSFVEVFVRSRQSKIVGSFYMDKEGLEEVLKNPWFIGGNGYVTSARMRTGETRIYLHRMLLNASEEDVVDHIDRNPLNNRRSNLRITTQSRNMMNSTISSDNTSGTKGISFDKKLEKWHAYISKDKKRIHLGYFYCLEDAIKARESAEKEHHGQYRLNGTKEGGVVI